MDPKKGVQYPVAVMTPQYNVSNAGELSNTPIASPLGSRGGAGAQTLGNLATFERDEVPVNITHWNAAQTFDVLASVQGRDGGWS